MRGPKDAMSRCHTPVGVAVIQAGGIRPDVIVGDRVVMRGGDDAGCVSGIQGNAMAVALAPPPSAALGNWS